MIYKLGSLFDGSGGFPLAGALCGIEPTWAAEVEPYPIAVTRSRFDGDADTPLLKLARKHHPELKLISVHLGNVCEINGAEIEPVDIITFGSPCQDLSVAGKRAGLKHEANGDEETTRSGLFMEAVRIIKEMREATNGRYPTFALWENVPGAFSSNNGEDFRVVCEELIKIVEPTAVMPSVPKGGWAYADSYCGDGWSLAYRVFDAQYWGVPQRRRRIHLIVDFRGERAREILFEREGLRGYFAQGRAPWKGTAPDAQNGTGADDCSGEIGGGRETNAVGADLYNLAVSDDKAVSLTANTGTSCTHTGPTVIERAFDAVGFDSYNLCTTGEIGRTVTTPSGGLNEHIPCVIERGREDNVVYAVDQGGGKSSVNVSAEVSPTLCTTHYGEPAVAYGLDRASFNQGQNAKFDFSVTEEQQPTLVAKGPGAVAYWDGSQVCGTLTANNAGGNQRMPDKENFNCVIDCNGNSRVRYIVRRLTPTECARLQGFDDRWGDSTTKTPSPTRSTASGLMFATPTLPSTARRSRTTPRSRC